jgi:class 3 adenylate cyclase
VFEENEIDLAALPHLTEDDLKDIGVKLGARRQMLSAIGALEASAPLSEAEDAEPVSVVTDADRRQLTVVFIDLVGSTALSGRLDPEDMRTTLGRYTDVVSDKIRGHGGYVANFLGDGVLAYFGWPTASED